MADKTDLTPSSPRNWGGQMIEFIRAVAEQLLARYTKGETDDKFLSKEDAESIYETKESSETDKNNLQSQITELSGSKADKTYVDNTFLTKEESSSSYNAPTASKLQTAVTINGTSFDGSKSITTEAWGEARQIQLFDSKEENFTTVTDFDGTKNLKLILPSSAYFKDIILDGSITANNLILTDNTGITKIINKELFNNYDTSITSLNNKDISLQNSVDTHSTEINTIKQQLAVVDIDAINTKLQSYIRIDEPQSFTDVQKSQARDNIGFTSAVTASITAWATEYFNNKVESYLVPILKELCLENGATQDEIDAIESENINES